MEWEAEVCASAYTCLDTLYQQNRKSVIISGPDLFRGIVGTIRREWSDLTKRKNNKGISSVTKY